LGDLDVRSDKIQSLDAARGIAILLVLMAHFLPNIGGSEAALANTGVILFFLLSGFLMDRNLASDGRIAPFAIRRAFRILPAYWLSIVIVAFHRPDWTVGTLLANATFTAPVAGAERLLGVYWTLYIEVLFYAVVPFLRLAGDRAIAATPYLVIALFGLLWTVLGKFNAAAAYILFCFAGMQFGLWQRKQLSRAYLIASLVAVSAASSLFPVAGPYLGLAPLAGAALIYLALQVPVRLRALEWVGRVSYSLYLIHTITGYAVMFAVISRGYSLWSGIFCGVVVSFATAYAVYRWIERPAITLGRVLATALALSRPPPQHDRSTWEGRHAGQAGQEQPAHAAAQRQG
jgi:peptidoglycan/LPS O-acetylase OafA/YrhL